ncbi:uncharacterized protein LACBIDRAFT_318869 [Laccaria bicolor S238N-H82]|uniref:Predicted protein n=1 Tax=Laccaria bicolor (strain S238N-H82 / ATCC MYA-4686) TaxID=486041 RepID=B0D7B1_LACBS|nr:uncharacterized protein LACBIDRAFT_318869 [Laccaria bicolor S238N-H82]EDR09622.1 predicted protein [Laccaria bicolor S238N-H82]|eukprot:XP_001879971.1 predicted protein [Laccaria bicolor S238N-H82]
MAQRAFPTPSQQVADDIRETFTRKTTGTLLKGIRGDGLKALILPAVRILPFQTTPQKEGERITESISFFSTSL